MKTTIIINIMDVIILVAYIAGATVSVVFIENRLTALIWGILLGIKTAGFVDGLIRAKVHAEITKDFEKILEEVKKAEFDRKLKDGDI